MTPRAWIVALALAIPFWIALLIISANAASPSPITPLPQSAFSPFGATEGAGSRDSSVGRAPRRPMAAVEVAGSSPVPGVSPAPSLAPTFVQVTPHPTTRPVSRTVPPYVEARGYATWQPGTGLWASPGVIVGEWHVSSVLVCLGRSCVRVAIPAHNPCACGMRHGLPTLVDLSAAAFSKLAPLGAGVIPVTVSVVQ